MSKFPQAYVITLMDGAIVLAIVQEEYWDDGQDTAKQNALKFYGRSTVFDCCRYPISFNDPDEVIESVEVLAEGREKYAIND